MKKRLILTILTALLFGACSNQNEVSQNETEKPVGFVQKEEKAKKEAEEIINIANKEAELKKQDIQRQEDGILRISTSGADYGGHPVYCKWAGIQYGG